MKKAHSVCVLWLASTHLIISISSLSLQMSDMSLRSSTRMFRKGHHTAEETRRPDRTKRYILPQKESAQMKVNSVEKIKTTTSKHSVGQSLQLDITANSIKHLEEILSECQKTPIRGACRDIYTPHNYFADFDIPSETDHSKKSFGENVIDADEEAKEKRERQQLLPKRLYQSSEQSADAVENSLTYPIALIDEDLISDIIRDPSVEDIVFIRKDVQNSDLEASLKNKCENAAKQLHILKKLQAIHDDIKQKNRQLPNLFFLPIPVKPDPEVGRLDPKPVPVSPIQSEESLDMENLIESFYSTLIPEYDDRSTDSSENPKIIEPASETPGRTSPKILPFPGSPEIPSDGDSPSNLASTTETPTNSTVDPKNLKTPTTDTDLTTDDPLTPGSTIETQTDPTGDTRSLSTAPSTDVESTTDNQSTQFLTTITSPDLIEDLRSLSTTPTTDVDSTTNNPVTTSSNTETPTKPTEDSRSLSTTPTTDAVSTTTETATDFTGAAKSLSTAPTTDTDSTTNNPMTTSSNTEAPTNPTEDPRSLSTTPTTDVDSISATTETSVPSTADAKSLSTTPNTDATTDNLSTLISTTEDPRSLTTTPTLDTDATTDNPSTPVSTTGDPKSLTTTPSLDTDSTPDNPSTPVSTTEDPRSLTTTPTLDTYSTTDNPSTPVSTTGDPRSLTTTPTLDTDSTTDNPSTPVPSTGDPKSLTTTSSLDTDSSTDNPTTPGLTTEISTDLTVDLSTLSTTPTTDPDSTAAVTKRETSTNKPAKTLNPVAPINLDLRQPSSNTDTVQSTVTPDLIADSTAEVTTTDSIYTDKDEITPPDGENTSADFSSTVETDASSEIPETTMTTQMPSVYSTLLPPKKLSKGERPYHEEISISNSTKLVYETEMKETVIDDFGNDSGTKGVIVSPIKTKPGVVVSPIKSDSSAASHVDVEKPPIYSDDLKAPDVSSGEDGTKTGSGTKTGGPTVDPMTPSQPVKKGSSSPFNDPQKPKPGAKPAVARDGPIKPKPGVVVSPIKSDSLEVSHVDVEKPPIYSDDLKAPDVSSGEDGTKKGSGTKTGDPTVDPMTPSQPVKKGSSSPFNDPQKPKPGAKPAVARDGPIKPKPGVVVSPIKSDSSEVSHVDVEKPPIYSDDLKAPDVSSGEDGTKKGSGTKTGDPTVDPMTPSQPVKKGSSSPFNDPQKPKPGAKPAVARDGPIKPKPGVVVSPIKSDSLEVSHVDVEKPPIYSDDLKAPDVSSGEDGTKKGPGTKTGDPTVDSTIPSQPVKKGSSSPSNDPQKPKPGAKPAVVKDGSISKGGSQSSSNPEKTNPVPFAVKPSASGSPSTETDPGDPKVPSLPPGDFANTEPAENDDEKRELSPTDPTPPEIKGSKPVINPDSKGLKPGISLDKKGSKPGTDAVNKGSMPSIDLDNKGLIPSIDADNKGSNPGIDPDKKGLKPSFNPDKHSATSIIEPDKSWSKPSINPDTKGSYPSINSDNGEIKPGIDPSKGAIKFPDLPKIDVNSLHNTPLSDLAFYMSQRNNSASAALKDKIDQAFHHAEVNLPMDLGPVKTDGSDGDSKNLTNDSKKISQKELKSKIELAVPNAIVADGLLNTFFIILLSNNATKLNLERWTEDMPAIEVDDLCVPLYENGIVQDFLSITRLLKGTVYFKNSRSKVPIRIKRGGERKCSSLNKYDILQKSEGTSSPKKLTVSTDPGNFGKGPDLKNVPLPRSESVPSRDKGPEIIPIMPIRSGVPFPKEPNPRIGSVGSGPREEYSRELNPRSGPVLPRDTGRNLAPNLQIDPGIQIPKNTNHRIGSAPYGGDNRYMIPVSLPDPKARLVREPKSRNGPAVSAQKSVKRSPASKSDRKRIPREGPTPSREDSSNLVGNWRVTLSPAERKSLLERFFKMKSRINKELDSFIEKPVPLFDKSDFVNENKR